MTEIVIAGQRGTQDHTRHGRTKRHAQRVSSSASSPPASPPFQRSFSSASASAGAELGTYAKSVHPPPSSSEAGAVQADVLKSLRADRYRLLKQARGLFVREGLAAGLVYGHDFHRTAKCRHIRHAGGARVMLATEHNRAFYAGVDTCASVWTCPVCAPKIQEKRRAEIAQGIEWAYAKEQGLKPCMVTLTFPHRAWHKLGDLFEKHAHALKLLRRGAPWERLSAQLGYEGLIRSLELTHGKNGWHVHTHEAWFIKSSVNVESMTLAERADALEAEALDLKNRITKQWASACARAGLLDTSNPKQVADFNEVAVDVKVRISSGDYLAKQDNAKYWGADRELAKSSSKTGKKSGDHPFRLLARSTEGDTRAGELFVQYAEAVKGKRQIFWTHGLKKRVGIKTKAKTAEQEEREDCDESSTNADVLALLTTEEWRAILKHEARSRVLDAAELNGLAGVLDVLQSLGCELIRPSPKTAPPAPPLEVEEGEEFDEERWKRQVAAPTDFELFRAAADLADFRVTDAARKRRLLMERRCHMPPP